MRAKQTIFCSRNTNLSNSTLVDGLMVSKNTDYFHLVRFSQITNTWCSFELGLNSLAKLPAMIMLCEKYTEIQT